MAERGHEARVAERGEEQRAHRGHAERTAEYFNEVHDFYASLPPDRFPALASVAPDMTGHDGDERFAFGLEVMISGLEAYDGALRR